eukprot:GILK01000178.1.p1 GENE.GILK01000178.1~~GILK01000178.1.p1  ORF type:complete len:136 (-),score=15.64 GILK01000178.1:134-541(-)
MSSELQWQLTRNNSCYLVKRNGIQLSRDPMNISNVHSFKFSGVNKKALGLNLVTKGKKTVPVLTIKGRQSRKPAKSINSMPLVKGLKRGVKAIESATKAAGYRPDLARAAACRLRALQSSTRPVSVARAHKKNRK